MPEEDVKDTGSTVGGEGGSGESIQNEGAADVGGDGKKDDSGSDAGQSGGETILGGGDLPVTDDGSKDGGEPSSGDTAKDDTKDWTLDAPEGLDADTTKQIEEGCKALGMSKDQAVKVLDMRKQERDAWAKQVASWRNEIAADPEFGGTKLQVSVVQAQKALAAFDPDGKVRALLESTGYGNNPDIIRMFARAGAAIAEEKFVSGDMSRGAREKSLADRMFANMEI